MAIAAEETMGPGAWDEELTSEMERRAALADAEAERQGPEAVAARSALKAEMVQRGMLTPEGRLVRPGRKSLATESAEGAEKGLPLGDRTKTVPPAGSQAALEARNLEQAKAVVGTAGIKVAPDSGLLEKIGSRFTPVVDAARTAVGTIVQGIDAIGEAQTRGAATGQKMIGDLPDAFDEPAMPASQAMAKAARNPAELLKYAQNSKETARALAMMGAVKRMQAGTPSEFDQELIDGFDAEAAHEGTLANRISKAVPRRRGSLLGTLTVAANQSLEGLATKAATGRELIDPKLINAAGGLDLSTAEPTTLDKLAGNFLSFFSPAGMATLGFGSFAAKLGGKGVLALTKAGSERFVEWAVAKGLSRGIAEQVIDRAILNSHTGKFLVSAAAGAGGLGAYEGASEFLKEAGRPEGLTLESLYKVPAAAAKGAAIGAAAGGAGELGKAVPVVGGKVLSALSEITAFATGNAALDPNGARLPTKEDFIQAAAAVLAMKAGHGLINAAVGEGRAAARERVMNEQADAAFREWKASTKGAEGEAPIDVAAEAVPERPGLPAPAETKGGGASAEGKQGEAARGAAVAEKPATEITEGAEEIQPQKGAEIAKQPEEGGDRIGEEEETGGQVLTGDAEIKAGAGAGSVSAPVPISEAGENNADTPAMTFEEFSRSRGVPSFPPTDAGLHRYPRRPPKSQQGAARKRVTEGLATWGEKRDELRAEYESLIQNGEIREPGQIERLTEIAKGEGSQAEAARRLLEKRAAKAGAQTPLEAQQPKEPKAEQGSEPPYIPEGVTPSQPARPQFEDFLGTVRPIEQKQMGMLKPGRRAALEAEAAGGAKAPNPLKVERKYVAWLRKQARAAEGEPSGATTKAQKAPSPTKGTGTTIHGALQIYTKGGRNKILIDRNLAEGELRPFLETMTKQQRGMFFHVIDSESAQQDMHGHEKERRANRLGDFGQTLQDVYGFKIPTSTTAAEGGSGFDEIEVSEFLSSIGNAKTQFHPQFREKTERQEKQAAEREAYYRERNERDAAEEEVQRTEGRKKAIAAKMRYLDDAVAKGRTDAGTAKLAKHLLETVDPSYSLNTTLEISTAVKPLIDAIRERIGKQTRGHDGRKLTPEEIEAEHERSVRERARENLKDEGQDPGDDPAGFFVAGSTDVLPHRAATSITGIAHGLYAGHAADDLVEEWYHRFWEIGLANGSDNPAQQREFPFGITRAEARAFHDYHKASGDPRSAEEHFAQEGRDWFFSEKLHEGAGPLRSLFAKARQAMLDLVKRIRRIRGANIPEAIADIYRRAGGKETRVQREARERAEMEAERAEERRAIREESGEAERDDLPFSIKFRGTQFSIKRVGPAEDVGPLGFYSQLARAAKDAKGEKMPGEQWLRVLEKSPGVKAEEIEWTGLREWLALQKGAVPKAAVVEYLKGNGVQVGEVIYPKAGVSREERAEEIRKLNQTIEEKATQLESIAKARPTALMEKHGGDRYENRPRLMAVPEIADYFRRYDETINARSEAQRNLVEIHEEIAGGGVSHGTVVEKGEKSDYTEHLLTFANAKNGEAFTHVHWRRDQNIIVHTRIDTREVGGKKALFVEEIQSDWHQQGKKRGYGREDEHGRAPAGWALQDNARATSATVPPAPFKDTKAWSGLAFKRIVRWAAENGHELIAWTTGKQQAERYRLAKHVKSIHWSSPEYGSNKRTFWAETEGTQRVNLGEGRYIETAELEPYIGKEATAAIKEKIERLDKGPRMLDGERVRHQMIYTKDLVIGGEGMKGFYDGILPSVAMGLGKKYGAKVGRVEIETGKGEFETVHSLEITPELKQAALEDGLPLFSIKKKRATENAEGAGIFKSGGESVSGGKAEEGFTQQPGLFRASEEQKPTAEGAEKKAGLEPGAPGGDVEGQGTLFAVKKRAPAERHPAEGMGPLPGYQMDLEGPKEGTGEAKLARLKPVKASAVIEKMAEVAGLPFRIRGYDVRATRGKPFVFKSFANIARLKRANDIASAAEAMGEAFSSMHRKGSGNLATTIWESKSIPEDVQVELKYLDPNVNRKSAAAGLPIYVKFRLTGKDPEKRYPKTTAWFDHEFLEKDPARKEGMEELKRMIDRYRGQGAWARGRAAIDFKGNVVKKSMKDRAERALVLWTDKYYHVEKLRKELTGKKRGDPAIYFDHIARMTDKTAGAVAEEWVLHNMTDFAGNPTGSGLRDILKHVAGDEADALVYAYARRALEVIESGRDPGPMGKADAEHIIRTGKTEARETFAKELTEWNRGVLRYAAAAGSIGEEELAAIFEKNEAYLPLQRVFDPSLLKGGGGEPRNAETNPLRKMHGSGREIKHPLRAMIGYAQDVIEASDKARFAIALVKASREHEGLGWLADEIEPEKEKVLISVKEIQDQLEALGGEDGAKISPGMIQIFLSKEGIPGYGNVIPVYMDGKRRYFEVHPEVFRAIQDLDLVKLPGLIKWLGAPAKALKLGTTGLNPAFGLIGNPLMDFPTYLVNSDMNFLRATYAWAREAFRSIKPDEKTNALRRIYRMRVGIAGLNTGDINSINQAIEHAMRHSTGERARGNLRHPVDLLREMVAPSESWPRMAELRFQMEKRGWKPGEPFDDEMVIASANAAKEVTLNFSRGGHLAMTLNHFTAFFNPGVQGATRMYRVLRDHPIRTAMFGAGTIFAPALALWYFFQKDEEWWQNLPAWKKWGYMNFRINGQVWSIKLPPELGPMFVAMPIATFDSLYRKDPKSFEEAFGQSMRSILPDVIPNFMAPEIGLWKNKNPYSGKPIVPKSMEDLDPSAQLGRSKIINQVARTLSTQSGHRIEISPIQVEYLLAGHAGGLPREILAFTEWLAGLNDKKRMMEPADWPIIGRLFLRDGTTRVIDDFYEEFAKARAEAKTRKYYEKAGDEKAEEYAADRYGLKRMENTAEQLQLLRGDLRAAETRKERQRIFDEMAETAAQGLGAK